MVKWFRTNHQHPVEQGLSILTAPCTLVVKVDSISQTTCRQGEHTRKSLYEQGLRSDHCLSWIARVHFDTKIGCPESDQLVIPALRERPDETRNQGEGRQR